LPADVARTLQELDVGSLSHTVTLGRRVDRDGRPTAYIENRGIAPHRVHSLIARDLSAGFTDMRDALLDELEAKP
jgi:hypothetical protein